MVFAKTLLSLSILANLLGSGCFSHQCYCGDYYSGASILQIQPIESNPNLLSAKFGFGIGSWDYTETQESWSGRIDFRTGRIVDFQKTSVVTILGEPVHPNISDSGWNYSLEWPSLTFSGLNASLYSVQLGVSNPEVNDTANISVTSDAFFISTKLNRAYLLHRWTNVNNYSVSSTDAAIVNLEDGSLRTVQIDTGYYAAFLLISAEDAYHGRSIAGLFEDIQIVNLFSFACCVCSESYSLFYDVDRVVALGKYYWGSKIRSEPKFHFPIESTVSKKNDTNVSTFTYLSLRHEPGYDPDFAVFENWAIYERSLASPTQILRNVTVSQDDLDQLWADWKSWSEPTPAPSAEQVDPVCQCETTMF